MAATRARAQAPDAGRAELLGSGLASASAWWGAPGRAGWLPDGDLGSGYPWTLAGLATAAWALQEAGRAPGAIPAPGVPGALGALVWYDSLRVTAGEDGAWEGFDAALVRVRAGGGNGPGPAGGGPARADILIAGGSRELSDNGLSLWRGDSLGGFRVEAASGARGAAGGLSGAGRDLYGIAGAIARGAHGGQAAFAHRRSQARLMDGASHEVRGESGGGLYRYQGTRWSVGAAVARGYDRRGSRGGGLPEQGRLGDATAAALEVERAGDGTRWGARAAWQESRVAITPEGPPRARTGARSGAARWQGSLGEGTLELALGLGRHDRIARLRLSPSLVWRFHRGPWAARVTVARLLAPVWSDLAPGQAAFLQDTWAGGLEVAARTGGGGGARLTFLAGHTRDRAVIARLPLESLALRSGWRADPHVYDFGLLAGEVHWRARRWALGVEGFALARDASPVQPWVDPGRGFRVFAEAEAALFAGELRLRPRVEVSGVGPRESETTPARSLAGYVSFAAGLQLRLGDAGLLVQARNLEDRPREQTWTDGATGREALGPGRELRATFTWRLWN